MKQNDILLIAGVAALGFAAYTMMKDDGQPQQQRPIIIQRPQYPQQQQQQQQAPQPPKWWETGADILNAGLDAYGDIRNSFNKRGGGSGQAPLFV